MFNAVLPPTRVLVASMIGTTIEYCDFWLFATAAVLVFPNLFFPASSPDGAMLQSMATFGVAFLARPVGAMAFGHFGDRIGRKATLAGALVIMGVSTTLIGLLPGYASIGVAAPVLLTLCRLGQGLGVGGEWGGAALLATENAPPGRQCWYGCFAQLGEPLGFCLANGVLLLLTVMMDDSAFLRWGWRIPFIASAALVMFGLYVRLNLEETPAFTRIQAQNHVRRVPLLAILRDHPGAMLTGALGLTAAFALACLISVFSLGWGTAHHIAPHHTLLSILLLGRIIYAFVIPAAAWLSDRHGNWPIMIGANLAIAAFGFFTASGLGSGNLWLLGVYLTGGLMLVGCIAGPLAGALAAMYPAEVRYTGVSLSLNLGGVLGGAMTPYVATFVAGRHGLPAVGWCLTITALVSAAAFAVAARKSPVCDALAPAET